MSTTRTITYATVDGEPLEADVYAPDGRGAAPVVICIHGGAWKRGSRSSYRFIGALLADAGYVVLSLDYRLMHGPANIYPAAIDDVRSAVAYVRAHAAELNADPSRIALMGDSAGGHLSAFVGLTHAAAIRVIVPIFGIFDLAAQWNADLSTLPHDNFTEQFLGVPLSENRQIYFEASPLTHAIRANNAVAVLLVWGTTDDIVAPAQSEAFLLALKQAGFFVRTIVQAAPHYWVGDPLDEPGSYSAFFAARLLRFLNERL